MESPTVAQESPDQVRRRVPRARHGAGEPGSGTLVLGRYRLRERLGAGGFGVVWSAHDELLRRDVAVKRIVLAPEEDGERASREALASARLAHPAIVALYEACPCDDAFYLISELVDGETLARLIADDELADEDVLEIGVALCDALEHAHERGVIHRDVKPQNVLVPHEPQDRSGARAPGGVAKLTDFGGARLSGQDALTRTGDVLGTLAYMAPEQSEGRGAGEQVDLYSLALVLYEALSGVNPVRGATPAETVRRIGRPLPSLARARRDLPRELTRSIDRALLRAPAARGTLRELREALEDALGEPTTGPLGDDPTRHVGRSAPIVARPAHRRALVPPPPWTDDGEPTEFSERAEQWRDAAARPTPQERGRRAPRRGMPRALWLALALALCVWQAASGRVGVALVLLCALAPIVAMPVGRRDLPGTGGWLSGVLAPALGSVGLASAFPALAGQAARWRMRAALGALGYWWLSLCEPLAERHLWLGPLAGTPARSAWEGSLSATAVHVVGPLLSVATLLGALLWAIAAALLPLLVRGRGAAADVVAASLWAGGLAVATPLLDGGLAADATHVAPRGLIVGAVLGGAVAVAARALRGPV